MLDKWAPCQHDEEGSEGIGREFEVAEYGGSYFLESLCGSKSN